MSERIEQCGGHLGVSEDGPPLAECQLDGAGDRDLLIEPGSTRWMEEDQKTVRGLFVRRPGWPPNRDSRQVSELVEVDEDQKTIPGIGFPRREVEPHEMLCEPAGPSCTGPGLQPVHQIDDIEKPAPGTVADDEDPRSPAV